LQSGIKLIPARVFQTDLGAGRVGFLRDHVFFDRPSVTGLFSFREAG
jgi:hypothetical protein